MIITFLTEVHKDGYEDNEAHSVLVDGKRAMYGNEWIQPEDTKFYRELPDPHDCANVIEKVIEHLKSGGDVTVEYEEKEVT